MTHLAMNLVTGEETFKLSKARILWLNGGKSKAKVESVTLGAGEGLGGKQWISSFALPRHGLCRRPQPCPFPVHLGQAASCRISPGLALLPGEHGTGMVRGQHPTISYGEHLCSLARSLVLFPFHQNLFLFLNRSNASLCC